IPVGNRKVFSLGAGWSPTADMTIDLAYTYLQEDSAKVDQHATELANVEIAPGYSAEYNNSAHGLGAQITYRF
ncbi:MAG: outer membrane protein transport protein, partial [Pseudomonas sp.]